MTEPGTPRVAVYLDFDNIVISRYDQIHGRNSFQRDKTAGFRKAPGRLTTATVDVGAIIDFASSFGTLVLTKAYADWSVDVNAEYRGQLVGRAVDLVQLFPAAAYAKNGADIRLAVDAVEDMFRLPDLTHVVIVAGDSDYIALAQRCKRLGRYVVGIGITGSISRSLTAACDEFVSYDALPGVPVAAPKKRTSRAKAQEPDDEPEQPDPQAAATGLLERALRIGHEKDDAYAALDLVDTLEADGMRLSGVLVTHHHPDHVGGSMMGFELKGLAELLERTSVPVHVNSLEADWVSRTTGIARSELTAHQHGDKLGVGDIDIELLHTPGHTPGSQCFLLDGRLVAGDTLFLEGCGRTDFPGGDVDAIYHSLQALAKLPGDPTVFPGHWYSAEPSASLSEVKRTNYVYRASDLDQWRMLMGA